MKVNGTFVALKKSQCIYDFLSMQKFDMGLIVVEHNGEIVPKGTYKDVLLKDADTLEIVTFVGGG